VIRASDAAVVCACLLGTAAFLVLFQRDLNRSLRRLDQEPAGFVSSRSGAALRRLQDRAIWDRLQKESPVYNGDFVRTADRSELSIGFPGGSLVGVSENSLIRVFVEEGAPRIDFSGGAISVQAGETGDIAIFFGENRVEAAAGSAVSLEADIEAAADADTGTNDGEGTYTFRVMEGSAFLTGPGGEREAAAGTAFTFNETGIFEEVRIAAAVPPPVQAVPVEAAAPVEPLPEPPPIRQVPAAAAPVELSPPPPPVRPSLLPAPSGREPGNGYRIDPETLRESRSIVFNWNPVEGADAYVFTIFHEIGFRGRQSVLSFEGPETSYTLEDLSRLDLGRFVWQVEAVNRGRDRRGRAGENLFTVDIPQPNIPRGRNPGDLYAR
jgi:hypothetical protein